MYADINKKSTQPLIFIVGGQRSTHTSKVGDGHHALYTFRHCLDHRVAFDGGQ